MRKSVEKLFSDHYRDICSYLFSLTHDVHLSEDLSSETFLEALRSISSFRGESDVKTWLFSIARHRWMRYLRRKKREPAEVMAEEYIRDAHGDALKECEEHLTAERIMELLGKEPERTRDIVLMRLYGYSFHEIASKHGISESSARVIDFRAKEKLREKIKEEGYFDG
ncbi:MAG: RNA polymerase sigma factor [Eubacteriales bacterium]|nr:RNA polymerase sigma factor [Eubacteriales bacterium]